MLAAGITEVTWTNLPKQDLDGKEYTYFVKEGIVEGGVFTEESPENYGIQYNGLNVTNNYIPDLVDIKATKTWVNGPAPRPTVWFKLYRIVRGGSIEEVSDADIKELADGVTEVKWEDLPKQDMDGKEYTYFVKEGIVEGGNFTEGAPENYIPDEDGLNVTNTYDSPLIDISVNKEWSDGNNKDGIRPSKIELVLYANSMEFDSKEMSASDDWKYTFENLKQFDDDGVEIVYTVGERVISGYSVSVSGTTTEGFTIRNSHNPSVDTVSVGFEAAKTLQNGVLSEGQFEFELLDGSGTVLEKVSNKADGTVKFKKRTYTDAGIYFYTIREVEGAEKRITYDKTVYKVKVTVSENAYSLGAKVDIEKDGVPFDGSISFTNVKRPPNTGDSTMLTALLIAAPALLGLSTAIKAKRRKK